MNVSPAIVTRRKARNSEGDEARIIRQAVEHSRGERMPLPIMNAYDPGSKPLGFVCDGMYCAYTSFDDILSEVAAGKKWDAHWSKNWSGNPVAGNLYDMFTSTGYPVGGTFTGAAATAVQYSDATQGALYHGGNVSTDTKGLLSAFPMATAGASGPTLYLYDRVLGYEACVFSTTTVTMTNTLTAQRYASGLPGLQCFVAAQTALGATAATINSMIYTNAAGTGSQTVPTSPSLSVIVSATAPTAINGARLVAPTVSGGTTLWSRFLPLQVGDVGMRSITSYTTSAVNTGTLTMVLCKQLAVFPVPFPIGQVGLIDFVQGLPSLPTIIDGACLSFLAFAPVATAANLFCDMSFGWS